MRVHEVQRFAERIDRRGVAICTQRADRSVSVRGAYREQRAPEGGRDGLGRVDGEHASALHERDAVAAVGFVHVRRGHENRQAARAEPSEQFPELAARPASTPSSARRKRSSAGGPARSERDFCFIRRRAPPRAACETARAARRSARSGRTRAPPSSRTPTRKIAGSPRRSGRDRGEAAGHVADLPAQRPEILHDVGAEHTRRAGVGELSVVRFERASSCRRRRR